MRVFNAFSLFLKQHSLFIQIVARTTNPLFLYRVGTKEWSPYSERIKAFLNFTTFYRTLLHQTNLFQSKLYFKKLIKGRYTYTQMRRKSSKNAIIIVLQGAILLYPPCNFTKKRVLMCRNLFNFLGLPLFFSNFPLLNFFI